MINLYRKEILWKFSKILLIKYHQSKNSLKNFFLNERRNAGIIISIITQRCLKSIKTDNHERNRRKHIGEITVLPIMLLTPYYTEVISLSVSSVQPDLKKGKTWRGLGMMGHEKIIIGHNHAKFALCRSLHSNSPSCSKPLFFRQHAFHVAPRTDQIENRGKM